jgi:hypothetical protein
MQYGRGGEEVWLGGREKEGEEGRTGHCFGEPKLRRAGGRPE